MSIRKQLKNGEMFYTFKGPRFSGRICSLGFKTAQAGCYTHINILFMRMVPQTTISKWMFGETSIS